jgi:5-methylcytosine-specific restriction endonuclease McrA
MSMMLQSNKRSTLGDIMGRPAIPVPTKFCDYCGKPLYRKRYNGRLEDRGAFQRRHYCDLTCSALGFRREDIQDKSRLCRTRKHRGTSCEFCGTTEQLNLHHVDGDRKNEARENLMTLCASCHTKLHWATGKTPPSHK